MLNASSYRTVNNLLLAFILINAVFLFSIPLLPFIDLPNHLSEAAIYKYHDEPGNVISQYYQPTPWYFPNTFHTVFCSLFPTVEAGNKVFHILYIILLQVSLFLIIRQLKGNPWYGLLGILFTYNYNVTFGFVGYAISIPAIMIVFYLTLRDIKEDKISLKAGIAITLVILFLMHAQNALFGLLLYGFMMLYRYRGSFKKLLLRAVVVPLPLVALIFAWWFNRGSQEEESTAGYLLDYYTGPFFSDFAIRFRLIVFDNFQLREGWAGLAIATLFFICLFVPLVYYKPWKNTSLKKFVSGDTVYAVIFFAASLACYLFLPDKLPGQSPLSQRFCTIVILSFIILMSIWLSAVDTLKLRSFVSVVAVCYVVLWFEYMYAFNAENRHFNSTFFKGLNNNSRLAGLMYDNKFRGRKVYIHFPNYFLVWRQGIVTSKIIDYRFGVVRRVGSDTAIPVYEELIGEHYKPVPAYAALEYILVRGKAPVNNDVNLKNFVLVKEVDTWQLYRNDNPEILSTYLIPQ
jgi:hypothetical protein